MDTLWIERWAKLITHYSLALQPGQVHRIRGTSSSAPLVRALFIETLRMGAHPCYDIMLEGLGHPFIRDIPSDQFLSLASEEQLQFIPKSYEQEVADMHAHTRILGYEYTRDRVEVEAGKKALRAKARSAIHKPFLERSAQRELRWLVTLWPTPAHAEDARMTLVEFTDFVGEACFLHLDDPVSGWKKFGETLGAIKQRLSQCNLLEYKGRYVDLSLRVGERIWDPCAGEYNLPDGEIFTGPIEDSANGWIKFTLPFIYGEEISGVDLEFRDGRVVRASAERGERGLEGLLGTDEGARRVGEVAFGLNPFIQRVTTEPLFDEKIGGTMHLALGSSYPETGGKNDSAVHMDMVCDLREDSEVFADGELIYKNGKFIF